MKLSEALKSIVKKDGAEAVSRPEYLYSRLADLIGADYCERGKLGRLRKIDRKLSLLPRLMKNDIAEVARLKEEYSSLQDVCNRQEFDEILEDMASVLVEGYTPFRLEEPNDFDYGFSDDLKIEEASNAATVENCLTDESRLMQFSVAQLRGYCRTHGLKGYAALNKRELVKLIMNGGTKATTPTAQKQPPTPHYMSRGYGVSFFDLLPWIGGALGIAILLAGAVCLGVFGKRIQWVQWQYIIGSVGGLLVCGLGFLLSLAIGWFSEDVIVSGFDGYRMAVPIVIAPLAIVNFVLALLFGEMYSIIFYWMSGYLLLASVVGTIYSFTDYETASGIFGIIDATAVAGMLLTQVLITVL